MLGQTTVCVSKGTGGGNNNQESTLCRRIPPFSRVSQFTGKRGRGTVFRLSSGEQKSRKRTNSCRLGVDQEREGRRMRRGVVRRESRKDLERRILESQNTGVCVQEGGGIQLRRARSGHHVLEDATRGATSDCRPWERGRQGVAVCITQ